jgi:fatty-acyl-CoA synthase
MYEEGLEKAPANHIALSPLSFLKRTALVYPDRESVIDGERRFRWADTYRRCRRLASALTRRGVGVGDTVATVAANIPAMYEAHFGVPMAGAVLNAINIRLDPATIAFILDHGEAKVVLVDQAFAAVTQEALALCKRNPLVVGIDDPALPGDGIGEVEYEALLAEGDPGFAWELPAEEWQAIALNYTSGTTGNPKGVVYHHRGAFLNSLGNIVNWDMGRHPVYLWILPMFHCNGWCFPWTVAAAAGTNVCLRHVAPQPIYDALADHGVTHFCAAPIVLNMLANAAPEERREVPHTVKAMTAGAPPPAAVLAAVETMGFDITHVYGLTESYGPTVSCAWKAGWDAHSPDQRAKLKSRQGVPTHVLDGLQVVDPLTSQPVPADGKTMGEVMLRGNVVMKGYLKNPGATAEAFAGGWFHTGDLAVTHSDGYIQLKDRSKDIIITGGENVSSVEVEDVLYRHPEVLEAAVVARPDEKWGETPCAFVTLRPDADGVTAEDILGHCRAHLAKFKLPKTVVFGPLPKTSTGKIQKYVLRQRAGALGDAQTVGGAGVG